MGTPTSFFKMAKILFNSVLYTPEGITKHAREEAKELLARGHQLFVTDINYKKEYGEEYTKMYTPFDRTKDDYIHYMIQPPIRPNNIPACLAGYTNEKRLFYFLAFEASLPKQWVEVINYAQMKCIIVPSMYNKKVFERSGIRHPIEILPHGIVPSFAYKAKQSPSEALKLLWAGTLHNSRKGLREAYMAFKTLSERYPHLTLTIKASGVYGCSEKYKEILDEASKNPRINIITDILSDAEMVTLFQDHHIYLSPHTSEGFGMHILEALGTGTPVVCSGWSGNVDFTKNVALHIDFDEEYKVEEAPYTGQIWKRPSVSSIIDVTSKLIENYDDYAKLFKKHSVDIHKKYSWINIVDQLEDLFIKYGAIN